MSVISVDKDFDDLTLTLVADFPAPATKVWELWADPRRIEQWWGPPGYPATFEEFDLSPGGSVTYYMTSPEGEKFRGWWRVLAVDAAKTLEFNDGFSDAAGVPVDDMPVTANEVRLLDTDQGTRMELRARFDTREEMERLDRMGMTEGLTLAVGQMDALLA